MSRRIVKRAKPSARAARAQAHRAATQKSALRAEREVQAATLLRAVNAESLVASERVAFHRERLGLQTKIQDAERDRDNARADQRSLAASFDQDMKRVREEHASALAALREEVEGEKAHADEAAKMASIAREDARDAELAQAAAEQRVDDLLRVNKAQEKSLVQSDQRIADLERALDEAREAVTRLVTRHHIEDGVSVRGDVS